MAELTERELYQEINARMRAISERARDAASQTVILSAAGIHEQEHMNYYLPVRTQVLPLLATLFKKNPGLAKQFVQGHIQEQCRALVMEEMMHFNATGLADQIMGDMLAAHKLAYAQYKEAMAAFRAAPSIPASAAKEGEDLDFTKMPDPLREEEEKLNALRAFKLEKYIVPFVAAHGVRFIMLLRESPEKAMSLLVQLGNRDLQVALCSRRDNPSACQQLKEAFRALVQKGKQDGRAHFRGFIFKFFYDRFDPTDATQKNRMPLEVIEDALRESSLGKEAQAAFSN